MELLMLVLKVMCNSRMMLKIRVSLMLETRIRLTLKALLTASKLMLRSKRTEMWLLVMTKMLELMESQVMPSKMLTLVLMHKKMVMQLEMMTMVKMAKTMTNRTAVENSRMPKWRETETRLEMATPTRLARPMEMMEMMVSLIRMTVTSRRLLMAKMLEMLTKIRKEMPMCRRMEMLQAQVATAMTANKMEMRPVMDKSKPLMAMRAKREMMVMMVRAGEMLPMKSLQQVMLRMVTTNKSENSQVIEMH